LRESHSALALKELELVALADERGLAVRTELLHGLLDLLEELSELLEARLRFLLLDLRRSE
jgi:hypothetical protein